MGSHFAEFVGMQARTGRYGSASEVVRAGLRLLEEHEAKVAALREALIAREAPGLPAPFDNDALIARIRAGHGG